jgi:hypothetical protein
MSFSGAFRATRRRHSRRPSVELKHSAPVLFKAYRRGEWKRRLALFIVGSTAGLALSSFLLLPFYEYMRHSISSHALGYRSGLQYSHFGLSLLTYFIPLLFGRPISGSALQEQFRNYFGLVSIFLIVIAIGSAWRRAKYISRPLNRLTLFFSASIVFLLLKRFGAPPVNWVGAIPVFRLVNFAKYDEPILTCCVWALAAIGVERIWTRQATRFLQCLAFASATLLLVVSVRLWRSAAHLISSQFAIHLAAMVIAVLFVCMLISFEWRARNKWFAEVIAALIAIELSFNYIIPVYRIYGRLPSVRENPYAGGPLVHFLEQIDRDGFRLFGRDWVLTPSWASVFSLPDIRDMDGLYYERYFPFLRDFLRPSDRRPTDPGPRGDSQFDWAAWSDFHFESDPPQATLPFKLLYNAEAKVYRYDNVLPRATIFYDTAIQRQEADVLRKLSDPSLDIFRTVVLDASNLSKGEIEAAERISQGPVQRVEQARIKSYGSERVEIEATLSRSGILVLNDSDYPGWRVFVDGRRANWFRANYLFQDSY